MKDDMRKGDIRPGLLDVVREAAVNGAYMNTEKKDDGLELEAELSVGRGKSSWPGVIAYLGTLAFILAVLVVFFR